ncbi:ImmA/IrrE family metallo-endopeptidase [Alkaliphilus serpentinus]|uniref:ImmA/IrrE family metallo-endopeptidase n=1 Tax=Alkaliphilus serpentinus TaxID=1482731 RepID=A0A833HMD3_9FIRM|nr:ImmA/IrrE family metallo-endopeptidase [Alkaliphilus serpentinus]KAB3527446.1 ImmA/IrrE family metallo-endopeptidase [Alkaliphilus serpentinus]
MRRIGDSDNLLINAKANRFAAEFLLPTETLSTYVKKHNRGNINLDNWNNHALLRLIAQLQIDYQVPYRMIVKRLHEIDSINKQVKKNCY